MHEPVQYLDKHPFILVDAGIAWQMAKTGQVGDGSYETKYFSLGAYKPIMKHERATPTPCYPLLRISVNDYRSRTGTISFLIRSS